MDVKVYSNVFMRRKRVSVRREVFLLGTCKEIAKLMSCFLRVGKTKARLILMCVKESME